MRIFTFLFFKVGENGAGKTTLLKILQGRHCQQYLSYIVAVSFIGVGNRSIRIKRPVASH
jgi:ABC-type molybdenum transport system ATPase subunit/photorepair protein PhrA